MKKSIYPKFALDGIKKNSRLYLPYIFTCVGMVMVTYIIKSLSISQTVKSIPGGSSITAMMEFGTYVIAVFSLVFIFYTNSFLIKRRKKELGLYNILGMEKKHIAIIIFYENLYIALISIVGGTAFGIAFSKLSELGLVNIMGGVVDNKFSVSVESIFVVLVIFAIIFALIFLNSVRRIGFSSTVDLLKGGSFGEKPPRANWALGISGVIVLASAYTIAITIENPLGAFTWFFIAVLMVIVGTYMIMICGSVLLCRIMQKNKRYYYKPNHFVSVSSMSYRMKRNGAGLASVCILATMILVIVSSTTCLFYGSEDSLNGRYPRQINCDISLKNTGNGEDTEKVRVIFEEEAIKLGGTKSDVIDVIYSQVYGMPTGENVECDVEKLDNVSSLDYSKVKRYIFISADEYQKLTGNNYRPGENKVVLVCNKEKYKYSEITFNDIGSYEVDAAELQNDNDYVKLTADTTVDSIVVIVDDLVKENKKMEQSHIFDVEENTALSEWDYAFDTDLGEDKQIELNTNAYTRIRDELMLCENPSGNIISVYSESRAQQSADYYGNYGGLFYLGILLSAVFIIATVLIIYYKQITEGYEDKGRFEIMKKVGMTKKEIRKSINSQLLCVFFLPLFFAAMHLAFAFPMLRKMLMLFSLNNLPLFVLTTLISFSVFAVFYVLVYKITSNAYYKIVSEMSGD